MNKLFSFVFIVLQSALLANCKGGSHGVSPPVSLMHPKAVKQFDNDIEAMEACDTCVLVLPCGRSAHTEAGWFAGRGKKVLVYIPEKQEPELMYKLFSGVCCSMEELIEALS